MPEEAENALNDSWQPVFRHSAGRLGSQFLTAVRQERRLMAWRTGRPERIGLPPKDFGGDGDWISVGPGASLLSFLPAAWLAELAPDMAAGDSLARVRLDGVPAPILARLRNVPAAGLSRGARLEACFAGDEGAFPGYWFEPAAAGTEVRT